MKRLDVDENTAISMPARNLITIIGACLVGAWFGFGVIERLNNIETKLQLMEKDLEAANTFIDGVPKGDMVSPQVQELYMLVEYLSTNVEKLKEQMEAEIPLILKNEMIIQFHDDWSCHKFIHNEKMTLLEQHIKDYGDALKSFELFCENRYGEEV